MKFEIFTQRHPLRKPFTISRGSKSFAEVVVVQITDADGNIGIGECVPYLRYSESVESEVEAFHHIVDLHGDQLSRQLLCEKYKACAIRNALDCALWDLAAKQSERSVSELAGLPVVEPVLGVCSLSLDEPSKLASSAYECRSFPLLKIKLGNQWVVESIQKVREKCPHHRIVIDANEAWSIDDLMQYLPQLAELGVEMIEQPLPAKADSELKNVSSEILFCADESFHSASDVDQLSDCYDVFNVKLDKTGGLTEAIEIAQHITASGKQLMVGSMMSTSYSLMPAMTLAHNASYVDLDSPIWLVADHPGGIVFADGMLYPAQAQFWG